MAPMSARYKPAVVYNDDEAINAGKTWVSPKVQVFFTCGKQIITDYFNIKQQKGFLVWFQSRNLQQMRLFLKRSFIFFGFDQCVDEPSTRHTRVFYTHVIDLRFVLCPTPAWYFLFLWYTSCNVVVPSGCGFNCFGITNVSSRIV